MATTFDPKCHELAEYFIDEISFPYGVGTKRPPLEWKRTKAHELACEIQQTIEDWMNENDPGHFPADMNSGG